MMVPIAAASRAFPTRIANNNADQKANILCFDVGCFACVFWDLVLGIWCLGFGILPHTAGRQNGRCSETFGLGLTTAVPARPAAAAVTGRFPHPLRDPAGHSFGVAAEPCPPPDPERWHECREYLHGLDFFNHGYYWESHEAWEQAWHAAGRRGATADFLKALIKLAAAGVKAREGMREGVRSHARRSAELFRSVIAALPTKQSGYFGLQLPELVAAAEAIEDFAGESAPWSGKPGDKPFALVLVLPFDAA